MVGRAFDPLRWTRPILALGVGFCIVCAGPVFAAEAPGVPIGPAYRVSLPTAHFERDVDVAGDADGNTVVAWVRSTPDETSEILARRFDASGNARGGVFSVSGTTVNSETEPVVAMDASGNFVVAWAVQEPGSNDGYDIYARRYNAAGAPQGASFRVNTNAVNDQVSPGVAMDAAGNFVVTWAASIDSEGSRYDVHARRYNTAGVAQGNEILVAATAPDTRPFPKIAMSAGGAFVVVWDGLNQDDGSYDVYAQRYNPAGVAQGAAFQVNTGEADDQRAPDAAMDASGNFAVTWLDDSNQISTSLYLRLYDAAGAPRGEEFLVNDNVEAALVPAVAMDTAGNFVVTWTGFDQDIRARRFNDAGEPQDEEILVNPVSLEVQIGPRIALDADGDFTIAWRRLNQDADEDFTGIWAQRFAGSEDVDLSAVIIDGPGPIVPGGSYGYNVIVSNNHAVSAPTGIAAIDQAIGAATGIRAFVNLPEGSTYVDSGGTGWICTHGARTSLDVVCDYAGVLRAMTSTSVDLLIEVQAPAAGDADADVFADGNQFDSNFDNNGDSVTSTIRPLNTIPDPFEFIDRTGIAPGAVVVSNAITVTGIEAPAPILIFGVGSAEYSIGGGSYTSEPGVVENGATVTVRLTAWDDFSTTSNAILVIGGVSGLFSVMTAPDTGSSIQEARAFGSGGAGSFDGFWLAAALMFWLLLRDGRPRHYGRGALRAIFKVS